MRIILKTKNIELTNEIKDLIQGKIDILERLLRKMYNETQILEAQIEIGKETLHHRKGPYFIAECQIKLSGRNIMAKVERDNLGEAIDEVKDELEREIKKNKEKMSTRAKRGARLFKKELKLSPQARFLRKDRIRDEGS